MILDTLGNIERYRTLHVGIFEGLEYLNGLDASVALGEYQVSPAVLAIVSSYPTKDQNTEVYEAHRYVIDVQYPIVGRERIEWSNLAGMEQLTEYDPAKDRTMWRNPGRRMDIIIGDGYFAVFFPEDAHNPALAVEQPVTIKKVTLKVNVK